MEFKPLRSVSSASAAPVTGNETGPLRIGIPGAASIAPSALIKPANGNDEVVIAVAARDGARAQAFATKHRIEAPLHRSVSAAILDAEIAPGKPP
jgi:predicted dehydrogenase